MVSDKHKIEGTLDPRCRGCFWESKLKRCRCGGVIHNEFEDETFDGEDEHVITSDHCDSCDDPREAEDQTI